MIGPFHHPQNWSYCVRPIPWASIWACHSYSGHSFLLLFFFWRRSGLNLLTTSVLYFPRWPMVFFPLWLEVVSLLLLSVEASKTNVGVLGCTFHSWSCFKISGLTSHSSSSSACTSWIGVLPFTCEWVVLLAATSEEKISAGIAMVSPAFLSLFQWLVFLSMKSSLGSMKLGGNVWRIAQWLSSHLVELRCAGALPSSFL